MDELARESRRGPTMWKSIVDRMLSRLIVQGRLQATYPDGSQRTYGQGEPWAGLRFADDATLRRICLKPELGLGEGYMDGRIVVENDDLDSLLTVVIRNRRLDAFRCGSGPPTRSN